MKKKLEEYKDLLTDPNYEYYMHGTYGSGADIQEEIKLQARKISSIFKNGLRTKNGNLYFTSNCMGDGNSIKDEWDSVKDTMDNWPHMGSENIIIMRLPKKYLNQLVPDSDADRTAACCVDIDEGYSEPTKYVNPKFIVGCYHSKTGNLTLNPKFEKDLSPETIKELDEKYMQCLEEFEKSRRFFLDNEEKKSNSQQEKISEGSSEEFQEKLTMDDTERLFD